MIEGEGPERLLDHVLPWISMALEAAGVAAIVAGLALACIGFLRGVGRLPPGETYRAFRTRLARGILLGLEFLVAADIIGTVAVKPTLQNLSVLGLIVLIRTFLSFSLELEIDGRWPWQAARDRSEDRST